MIIDKLRKKNIKELNHQLLNLMYEKFTLKMNNKNIQKNQRYLLKQIRRNIARIKMLLTEKSRLCINDNKK